MHSLMYMISFKIRPPVNSQSSCLPLCMWIYNHLEASLSYSPAASVFSVCCCSVFLFSRYYTNTLLLSFCMTAVEHAAHWVFNSVYFLSWANNQPGFVWGAAVQPRWCGLLLTHSSSDFFLFMSTSVGIKQLTNNIFLLLKRVLTSVGS